MLTTAALEVSSLRLTEIFKSNQFDLSNRLARVASGKRVRGPSDNSVDYFYVRQMRADIRGHQQVGRELAVGGALVDMAIDVGGMVFEDVNRLGEIIRLYYDDSTSGEEKDAYRAEFESVKNRIADTISGSYYGDHQLVKDYGATPLMKIILDPRDVGQTYDISYDSGDVADVSGLTLGVTDLAAEQGALQTQLDKAASYLAKSVVYGDSIVSHQNMLAMKNVRYLTNADEIENADQGAEIMALVKKSLNQQMAASMMAQTNMFRAGIAAIVSGK
jgi:flagellin-like hook-associated protein FlgL